MRSIAFAVVIFAGVLACSSAAPQLNRFDLGWLDAILREAGQRNNTVRFGNNTVIISGVSNAHASTNDGTINPVPPSNQWNNNGYNGYNPWIRYPYNNGYYYYRTLPTENGEQIIEVPVSSSEESQEMAYDVSDDQSEEDVYHQEDQTVEDEEDEAEDEADDEAEDELDEEPEDAEEATNEEAEEVEDEVIDPEEEAVDAELEVIENELNAKESN
ncbi:hypothetical protein KR032_011156 [Drosophila birchii]|nr:hypothetical protein KR032_011156 [Drosophila birchii]